jgi:NitT/TauT family transport system ATP-binding protein
LPRPRDVFHIHETSGFSDIYDAIWNDLREEILKERDEYADA